jgi:hypothetical protein
MTAGGLREGGSSGHSLRLSRCRLVDCHGGTPGRDGLINGEDHEVLLGQLNDLFTRSSTGKSTRYGS